MSVWKRLASRYEGKEDRKHRLLALDGGGIRGILTLEVLARMETLLAEATGIGSDFRLCQFFDYIGGTSTGAIIAAGLARGMSVTKIIQFYQETGPTMFKKQTIINRLSSKYKAKPLTEELQKTFGKLTTLKPDDLECLFLAVTRNVTTDSPWPISSNPQAKYNQITHSECNLVIPLWKIVRASTAAPLYFPPEEIQLNPKRTYKFVDGGVTPYNNPAFLVYRMATEPRYRLNWATGEDKLLLMSVGTGASVEPIENENKISIFSGAKSFPHALMYAVMIDQDTCCRHVGRCVHGAKLDREIGDMIPRDAQKNEIPLSKNLGRQFIYARYNADLSKAGLEELKLSDIKPENVQKLDSIDFIDDLRHIGKKVAEEVKIEHFGSFIE